MDCDFRLTLWCSYLDFFTSRTNFFGRKIGSPKLWRGLRFACSSLATTQQSSQMASLAWVNWWPSALMACYKKLYHHELALLKWCSFDWRGWLVAFLQFLRCVVSVLSLCFYVLCAVASHVGQRNASQIQRSTWEALAQTQAKHKEEAR